MSDEQLRELEHQAQSGDVEAAARLVLLNARAYGNMCGHWVRSQRMWNNGPQVRLDHFCLFCGLNLDYEVQPGTPPRLWKDCGGREVEQLRQAQVEHMAQLAAQEAARQARL